MTAAFGEEASKKRVLYGKMQVWFNYVVACLTTGPKPLPKRALHIV